MQRTTVRFPNSNQQPYKSKSLCSRMTAIFTYSFADFSKKEVCTLTIIALLTATIVWKFTNGHTKSSRKSNNNDKRSGSSNKAAAPLSLEQQITYVEEKFEHDYAGRVATLLRTYDESNSKDVYEKNYCNEMLLKLLIELDNINLIDQHGERKLNLKQHRKSVIHKIQDQLKALDRLSTGSRD